MFVSKKMPNNAVTPQSSTVLIVLVNNQHNEYGWALLCNSIVWHLFGDKQTLNLTRLRRPITDSDQCLWSEWQVCVSWCLYLISVISCCSNARQGTVIFADCDYRNVNPSHNFNFFSPVKIYYLSFCKCHMLHQPFRYEKNFIVTLWHSLKLFMSYMCYSYKLYDRW